jgi:hypothetical protein
MLPIKTTEACCENRVDCEDQAPDRIDHDRADARRLLDDGHHEPIGDPDHTAGCGRDDGLRHGANRE